jgi:hypothetical protein
VKFNNSGPGVVVVAAVVRILVVATNCGASVAAIVVVGVVGGVVIVIRVGIVVRVVVGGVCLVATDVVERALAGVCVVGTLEERHCELEKCEDGYERWETVGENLDCRLSFIPGGDSTLGAHVENSPKIQESNSLRELLG